MDMVKHKSSSGIFKKFSLSLALIATAMTACGDRSLQDFKDEQLKRDLAKLPQKSEYSGYVNQSRKSEKIAALKVALAPEVNPKASGGSDNARIDGQAVLRVSLEFQGKQYLQFVIPDALYITEASKILANFNLTPSTGSADGGVEEMIFSAQLQGGHMIGSLQARNSPDLLMEFDLTLNGKPVKELALTVPGLYLQEDAQSGGQSQFTRTLTGLTHYRAVFGMGDSSDSFTKTLPGTLVVIDEPGTPVDEFLKLFRPVRVLQMTVSYGAALSFNVPKAQWNRLTGQLTGSAEGASGVSKSTGFTLDCRVLGQDGLANRIQCKFISALQGVVAQTEFSMDGNTGAGSTTATPSMATTFLGDTRFSNSPNKPVLKTNLVMIDPSGSPVEEFARVFNPLVQVGITLNFGGELKLSFTKIQWDRRTGHLIGLTENTGEFQLGLDCIWETTGERALDCRYVSSSGGEVARARFTPSAIQNFPDPFGTATQSKNCVVDGVHVSGTPKPGQKAKPVGLALKLSSHASMDELMELFFTIQLKSVQAVLDINHNGNAVVNFANSKLDPQTHTLDSAASSTVFALHCKNVPDWNATQPADFDCDYSSSNNNGVFLSFRFSGKTWKCGN